MDGGGFSKNELETLRDRLGLIWVHVLNSNAYGTPGSINSFETYMLEDDYIDTGASPVALFFETTRSIEEIESVSGWDMNFAIPGNLYGKYR